jgi:hypothetical protein
MQTQVVLLSPKRFKVALKRNLETPVQRAEEKGTAKRKSGKHIRHAARERHGRIGMKT